MALFEGRWFTGVMTDRRYDGDSFAAYNRVFLTSGVKSTVTDLQVTIGTGMQVTVGFGFALVDGYLVGVRDNDTGVYKITIPPAGTSLRRDRLIIRKDANRQAVEIIVKQGTASPPALEQTEYVYEVSLAQIVVRANTTVINATDITDERSEGFTIRPGSISPKMISTDKLADKAVTSEKLATDAIQSTDGSLKINLANGNFESNKAISAPGFISPNSASTLRFAENYFEVVLDRMYTDGYAPAILRGRHSRAIYTKPDGTKYRGHTYLGTDADVLSIGLQVFAADGGWVPHSFIDFIFSATDAAGLQPGLYFNATKNTFYNTVFFGDYLEIRPGTATYARILQDAVFRLYRVSAPGTVLYSDQYQTTLLSPDNKQQLRCVNGSYPGVRQNNGTWRNIVSGVDVFSLATVLQANGNRYLQIETSSGVYGLSGIWSSDTKLKKDIKDSSVDALAAIMQLQIREFTWKEIDKVEELGLVANELEKVIPAAVFTSGEYKQIDPAPLISYLIKAVQQLEKRVADLEGRDE